MGRGKRMHANPDPSLSPAAINPWGRDGCRLMAGATEPRRDDVSARSEGGRFSGGGRALRPPPWRSGLERGESFEKALHALDGFADGLLPGDRLSAGTSLPSSVPPKTSQICEWM